MSLSLFPVLALELRAADLLCARNTSSKDERLMPLEMVASLDFSLLDYFVTYVYM